MVIEKSYGSVCAETLAAVYSEWNLCGNTNSQFLKPTIFTEEPLTQLHDDVDS